MLEYKSLYASLDMPLIVRRGFSVRHPVLNNVERRFCPGVRGRK